MTRLRVGLVGAGPWAGMVHAPVLAEHPDIQLVSVWARRPEAAEQVAGPLGAVVAADPDELIGSVDAVAFAVPPTIQAELAARAARAGRHLILEKPLAGDLAAAIELARVVEQAEVAALVMLTARFAPETEAWLAEAERRGGWLAGDARWLNDAALAGPFSGSPWRKERGALLDVGPHVLDLLDAGLGRIVDVPVAHRTEPDLWHLVLSHETGVTSTATLSLQLPVSPGLARISLAGKHGELPLERSTSAADSFRALCSELVAMVEEKRWEHPCDVRRGLHLQQVLDMAEQRALR
ncbi:MAG TPA: Gfo/Idh/MocA family oxidoreductase [Pseudonocardiaceae bacterium]|nr:Gfo/Idh/MocA family oxidoreductase [Pseudonocardiaceae bacterium]